MRLHLVGLPHTSSTREYEWCAYTSKVRKFATMMSVRGHDVVLYAGPENEADCTEHVVCNREIPPNGEIPPFEASDPLFAHFNRRAVEAIGRRIEPRDIVCLIGGQAQAPIAAAFPKHLVCEFGIGYGGILPNAHHVFESYAWMHTVLGAQAIQSGLDVHGADGRFYDTVIPNYFEVEAFPEGGGQGGYLLYVGRLIGRKGVEIAVEVSKRTGIPLKLAGAGTPPDHGEYLGVIGPEQRAEVMGGAIALLAPTLYVEPFGGVAVECQLTGTPAITTDFGAFTETVQDGVTGYRCNTIPEFVTAVESAASLDRCRIRERAIAQYGTEAIAPMYERYFGRLSGLWGGGVGDWYGNLTVAAWPK